MPDVRCIFATSLKVAQTQQHGLCVGSIRLPFVLHPANLSATPQGTLSAATARSCEGATSSPSVVLSSFLLCLQLCFVLCNKAVDLRLHSLHEFAKVAINLNEMLPIPCHQQVSQGGADMLLSANLWVNMNQHILVILHACFKRVRHSE